MRLFYLVELLATVALGLAACRTYLSDKGDLNVFVAFSARLDVTSREWWAGCLWPLMDVFLWAVAPAAGLGLAAETAGRRGVPWGFGRRMICMCSTYVMICLTSSFISVWRNKGEMTWALVFDGNMALLDSLAWVVIAYALTLWFSGRPRDSPCDAREWTGRLYAAATLLPVLIWKVLL